jgi:hypothetical protein
VVEWVAALEAEPKAGWAFMIVKAKRPDGDQLALEWGEC